MAAVTNRGELTHTRDAPPRSFLSMDMANDKDDDDEEAEEAVTRFGGWKLSENESFDNAFQSGSASSPIATKNSSTGNWAAGEEEEGDLPAGWLMVSV